MPSAKNSSQHLNKALPGYWMPGLITFVLPFVLVPTNIDPFVPLRNAVLAAFVLVGWAWLILQKAKLEIPWPTVTWTAGLGFLVLGITACVGAFNPLEAFTVWIKWVFMASAATWVLILLRNDARTLDRLLLGCLAAAGGLVFIRLLQDLGIVEGIPSAIDLKCATMGNRNFFDGALVMLIPACVKLFLDRKDSVRWLAAALVLWMSVIVMTDVTSGAKLALLASAAVMAMAWVAVKWPSSFWGRIPWIRLAVLIVGMAGAGFLVYSYWQNLNASAESQVIQAGLTSSMERVALWKASLDMIKEQPLFGMGPGHWPYAAFQHGLISSGMEWGSRFFMQPHNDFLEIGAEWGLPALLAFIALIGSSFVFAFLFPAGKGSSTHILAAGGLAAWVVFALFNLPAGRPFLLWMLLIYVCVGASLAPKTNLRMNAWPRTSLALGSALIILVLHSYYVYLDNHFITDLFKAKGQGQWTKVAAISARIPQWPLKHDRVTNTPIDWYAGLAASQTGQPESAANAFEKAAKVNPWHPHVCSNLAITQGMLGMKFGDKQKLKSAAETLEELLTRFPAFEMARQNLITIQIAYGDTASAYQAFKYWDNHIASPISSGYVASTKAFFEGVYAPPADSVNR